MAWTEGSILGQTELLDELRRPDGRTLWRARDIKRGDARPIVLIETGRSSWQGDATELLAFHAAAEAAVALRHPALVRVLRHGLDEQRMPFVVRETTPSITVMSEVTSHGSMGLRRVSRIVEQLLRVLDLVHAQGLARSGVTPDLVYLCGATSDQVKLWVELVSLKPTRAARDLCCAAPERLLKNAEVDHRASLWEVAALAYYALTGQAAFVAPNPAALARAVREGDFARIALRGDGGEASRIELDAWFRRAFACEPDARFATAREMLDAWQNVVGGLLMFVDEGDAGAVSLVPPPSEQESLKIPPIASVDTERTKVFERPSAEEMASDVHRGELPSLLDDEEELETFISASPVEEEEEKKKARDLPPPSSRSPAARTESARPAEVPQEPSVPMTRRSLAHEESALRTEFPATTSVRPEAASNGRATALMLVAGVIVAAMSSVATTYMSNASEEPCECAGAAVSPQSTPSVATAVACSDAPSAEEKTVAAPPAATVSVSAAPGPAPKVVPKVAGEWPPLVAPRAPTNSNNKTPGPKPLAAEASAEAPAPPAPSPPANVLASPAPLPDDPYASAE